MDKNVKLLLDVAKDQLKDAGAALADIAGDTEPLLRIDTALRYARRAVETLELASMWTNQGRG